MNTQLNSILIQQQVAEHASLRRAAERMRLARAADAARRDARDDNPFIGAGVRLARLSARGQPRRGAPLRVALVGSLGLLLALVLAAVLAPPAPAAATGSLQQTLTAPDGAFGDDLGTSVAVQGDTLVLGAPGDEGSRGSVYVFQRTGDSWTETAKLTASDAASGDELGHSVAIDGDTIVAGAPFADISPGHDQGAVYTFARTGAATPR